MTKKKLANKVWVSVFAEEADNPEGVESCLRSFLPENIKEEEIRLEKRTAKGFNDTPIHFFELELEKDRQINPFLEKLSSMLTSQQKELLLRQADNRLDEDLKFFMRLDKAKLLKEGKAWITDSGDCFHIKVSLAVFPKKTEGAIKLLNDIFGLNHVEA